MSSRNIGRFVVHDQLGRGGTGVVSRAWDERLDRWVAIKSVRQDSSPGGRQGLYKEARLMADVDHPAVVRVHEVVSDNACDHIVMELVSGRPLSQIVADGPLDVADTVAIAAQIAGGLEAAHERGLIHGDLKTQNIMLTGERRVKILDFGMTADLRPSGGSELDERHDVVVGTACAMSPEQAAGRPLDPRSDLFSLGTLIYQMATGCHPFYEHDPFQTMHNVTIHDPPPAHHVHPGVPEPLSMLIHELLEKTPDNRPRSAGEVAERLKEIQSTSG